LAQDPSIDVLQGDVSRRGGNQLGLRQYNERLIISLVLEAGALSKADIARITRLSPQTATIIVNRLLRDGLLRKKAVVRGRVGQPSTPIELAPDGALSIGVKIGRRSLDLLALSFDRRVIAQRRFAYDRLVKDDLFELMEGAFATLKGDLTPAQRARLVGVGVAAPTAIESGEAVIGDPGDAASRWREADLLARVEETSNLHATVLNDAIAACLAEIEFGKDARPRSMVYFYLSTLVGGGIVVDGKLIAGRTGNAGAFNALPLGLSSRSDGAKPAQLIESASLSRLETIAAKRGVPFGVFREDGGFDDEPDAQALACFDEWCTLAADSLAFAAISGTSIIEAEAVVIDGVLKRSLLAHLIARVERKMADYNLEGIILPQFRLGCTGFDARALGAALLPMNENFAPDNKVLLKD
jgi:predicted NBD/HSP70 family sugar kinase